MVTTTHDPRSGGQPRLIAAPGDTAPQHASQREFDPVPGVTVIGSGPQADVRLEGFEAHHAKIRSQIIPRSSPETTAALALRE